MSCRSAGSVGSRTRLAPAVPIASAIASTGHDGAVRRILLRLHRRLGQRDSGAPRRSDHVPERNHVAAGFDPSGRLPDVFTNAGTSSFTQFLSQAAPELLPGRRPLPPGTAGRHRPARHHHRRDRDRRAVS